MNALPVGWATATTADLFSFVTSGSRGWARYYADEGAAFIRVGDLPRDGLRVDLSNVKRVVPPPGVEGLRTRVLNGDILISITADLGRVALATDLNEDAYINQHVALARPVEWVDSTYLAWYLTSDKIQRHWLEQQRGVTKLGLGLNDIRSVQVPLPPVAEQKRIVGAIEKQFSRLDAGVASMQRALNNLIRMRMSVLEAGVSGSLTEPASHGGNGDWPSVTPVEIAADKKRALAIGPFGSNLKVSDYTQRGVPLVFVRQVRSRRFSEPNTKYISAEKADELKAHGVRGGDVLITKMGEPPGEATVYPRDCPDGVITADVIKISVREGVMAEFVAMAINSRTVRNQITSITSGVAQQKVSLARFRHAVRFPLPPLGDQAQIVEAVSQRIEEIDRAEAEVQDQLSKVRLLRSSILHSAFSGRLVNQNPLDESAAALVDRIARSSSTSRTPKLPESPQSKVRI